MYDGFMPLFLLGLVNNNKKIVYIFRLGGKDDKNYG